MIASTLYEDGTLDDGEYNPTDDRPSRYRGGVVPAGVPAGDEGGEGAACSQGCPPGGYREEGGAWFGVWALL